MDVIGRVTLLFQYANVAIFVVVFVAAWRGVGRRRGAWLAYLPAVGWAAAGVFFFLLTFVGLLSGAAFILLGAAHRTGGAALILAMVLVMAGEADEQ